MSLGVGIFLGLLCLSLVLLFNFTKDRWNWRKLLSWVLGLPFALCLIGAGLVWGPEFYNTRPRVQTELWGLSPGLESSEVIFRKGAPTDSTSDRWNYNAEGAYGKAHSLLMVQGKVWCVYEDLGAYGDVQGISTHSTQRDIEKKFGRAEEISNTPDHRFRLLSYDRYQLVFELAQDRVLRVGVYDSKLGSPVFVSE